MPLVSAGVKKALATPLDAIEEASHLWSEATPVPAGLAALLPPEGPPRDSISSTALVCIAINCVVESCEKERSEMRLSM